MPQFKSEKERRSYERLKRNPLAYGGHLRNTRFGRARPRPLVNGQSMHLILKSSRARGQFCMRTGDQGRNLQKIFRIVRKFAGRHRVKIHRFANVGNHLHLHVQLADFHGYNPFIRAVTAAIAMAVTKCSRWKKAQGKFWDLRPFTHIVVTRENFRKITNYVKINQLEPVFGRREAERLVARLKPA